MISIAVTAARFYKAPAGMLQTRIAGFSQLCEPALCWHIPYNINPLLRSKTACGDYAIRGGQVKYLDSSSDSQDSAPP